MPRSEELIDLYSSVTTCAMRCSGIQNDPVNGIMGRSFYCLDESVGIDILLVSKNPGISDPRENALYSPLSGRDRVRAHEDFVRARFLGSNHVIASRYHANIINWVSVILDIPAEHDAVFSRVAMTALVKCHSANLKTDSLPDSTKDTCVGTFLYREIQLVKPKFLLALGGEAFEYLVRPSVVARHRLAVGRLISPELVQHARWCGTLRCRGASEAERAVPTCACYLTTRSTPTAQTLARLGPHRACAVPAG